MYLILTENGICPYIVFIQKCLSTITIVLHFLTCWCENYLKKKLSNDYHVEKLYCKQ